MSIVPSPVFVPPSPTTTGAIRCAVTVMTPVLPGPRFGESWSFRISAKERSIITLPGKSGPFVPCARLLRARHGGRHAGCERRGAPGSAHPLHTRARDRRLPRGPGAGRPLPDRRLRRRRDLARSRRDGRRPPGDRSRPREPDRPRTRPARERVRRRPQPRARARRAPRPSTSRPASRSTAMARCSSRTRATARSAGSHAPGRDSAPIRT